MKRFIFSLMALFTLSLANIAAIPQADYMLPEITEPSVQSYEMPQLVIDIVNNEFAAVDFVFVEIRSVENAVLELKSTIEVINPTAILDIGINTSQFRLCSLFDNHTNSNSPVRYSKRYNIYTLINKYLRT